MIVFSRKVITVIVSLGMLLSFGCYYDVEEELYPTNNCVTTNVSYSNDVLPILQNNCYSCHDAANNQGGVTLEGHAQVKLYATAGHLVGALRHDTGFSPMPQSAPKLPDCLIEKIEGWIAEGALDN